MTVMTRQQTKPVSAVQRSGARPLLILTGAAVVGLTALCVITVGFVMLARAGAEIATPTPYVPATGEPVPTANPAGSAPGSTPAESVNSTPQPTADEPPAQAVPVAGRTYRVTEVLAVTEADCNCGANFKWEEWSVGAELVFDDGGRFLYVPVGIGSLRSSDLYPMGGSYTEGAGGVTFDGSSAVVYGAGITSEASIHGRIWADASGSLRVQIFHRADSITTILAGGRPISRSLYSVVEYEAVIVAVS